MTTRELLEEFERLSRAERIQVVQDMWDRIAATPTDLPALTEGQERELRRRIASYTENPGQTLPAEDVFASLQRRGGDTRSV